MQRRTTTWRPRLKYSSEFYSYFDIIYVSLILPRESLALFTNDYHKGSHSAGHVLSTIQSGNLPTRPTAKKCVDCPLVSQWTQKEFRRTLVQHTNTQHGDTDGSAISSQTKGKCGCPCKDAKDDGKTTHFYLETMEGLPVLDEVITEMSHKACMLWRMLHKDGMALQTFGQISMKAWEYYSIMMLADNAFNFLLLCNDSKWKLWEWSTRSYPSWHCNRFNKDTDNIPQTSKSEFHLPHVTTQLTYTANIHSPNPWTHSSQQWHGGREPSNRQQQWGPLQHNR